MWWAGLGLGFLAVVLGAAFVLYSRSRSKLPPYEPTSPSAPYNRRSMSFRSGNTFVGIGLVIVFVSLFGSVLRAMLS